MYSSRYAVILILLAGLILAAPPASPASESDRPWIDLSPDLDQALDRLCFDLVQTQFPVERVAVPDPKGPGRHPSDFSVYLVEEIGRRLAREQICVESGGLGTDRKCRKAAKEVLERRGLYDVLQEQSLEQAAVFDQAEVASKYRKVGVDGLVMLTVQDHGEELWISAKLVDVRRGSRLSGAKVRLGKSEEVKAMLARPLKADLALTVTPPAPGGTVRLGDRTLRLGPHGAVMRGLPQGIHRISLEAKCRKSFSRDIYLSGDRTLAMELEPEPAVVELLVKPSDAVVAVDGNDGRVFLNEGGMASVRLAPGRHVITAKVKGLPAKSVTLDLDCGPRSVSMDLTPPKHLLTLEVSPEDAELFLDGKRLRPDAGGRWQGRVTTGEHRLRALATGRLEKRVNLLVEKDVTSRLRLSAKTHVLDLKLSPVDAKLFLDGQPVATDSSGRARQRASQGRHVLSASAKGCASRRVEIELNGDRSLEISLKPLPIELEFAGIYQDPDDPSGAVRTLEPGSVLKSGWYYAVAVKVSRTAHVYVYQLDSMGKVSRLFPRPSFPELVNPVEPGKWVWSPPAGYRSRLDDNTGREVIFVVAASRPEAKYSRLYARLEQLKKRPRSQGKGQ